MDFVQKYSSKWSGDEHYSILDKSLFANSEFANLFKRNLGSNKYFNDAISDTGNEFDREISKSSRSTLLCDSWNRDKPTRIIPGEAHITIIEVRFKI